MSRFALTHCIMMTSWWLKTPMLILMGIPPAVAVGTQAAQILASSVSGVLANLRRKAVDMKMGWVLVAGGLVRTDHLEPGARTHHVLDRAVLRVRNHGVFGSECHDHRLSAVADTFIPRPFPGRPRGTRLTRVPEPARLALRLLGLSRPNGNGPITIDLRRLRRP